MARTPPAPPWRQAPSDWRNLQIARTGCCARSGRPASRPPCRSGARSAASAHRPPPRPARPAGGSRSAGKAAGPPRPPSAPSSTPMRKAAGTRPDPALSVPSAKAQSPAATADPDEDPPETRAASKTDRGAPWGEPVPFGPVANRSGLVLPITIAPAAHSRAITVASRGGSQGIGPAARPGRQAARAPCRRGTPPAARDRP